MKLAYSLCFFILLCNGPCTGVAYAQRQSQTDLETKNILVLHAFEANVPVFVGTDQGLLTTLESSGISGLNQFFESLDLRRNPVPNTESFWSSKMRMRYGRRKIDMIVTMYPKPWNLC